jgi:Asp-tRNA(Asn)/Glu-tRNA(Gln) amidotransferase A subunit family amidase
MLNAIVAINPEAVKARNRAKQIKYDHAIYGIPILIKTINVEGMPTTGTHCCATISLLMPSSLPK